VICLCFGVRVAWDQGLGGAREKFYEFFVKQSFFSSERYRFWSLGLGGWVGGIILVLRTIPESVGRSAQNLA